jgi:hypothetical protein
VFDVLDVCLTPDAFGNYVNGTWTQLASLPADYSPLYHASAVLPDGRVIIEGGEYNFLTPVWTNQDAIYDPRSDAWTSVSPPSGWTSVGDAPGVVLFDGTLMLGNCCTVQAALLDPATLTWTSTGRGKFDTNNEEGWTLLPKQAGADGRCLRSDKYPLYSHGYEFGDLRSRIGEVAQRWQHHRATVGLLVDLWRTVRRAKYGPDV